VVGITGLKGLHTSFWGWHSANKDESLITEMCDKYSKLTTKQNADFAMRGKAYRNDWRTRHENNIERQGGHSNHDEHK
jgi:hypothetical protein